MPQSITILYNKWKGLKAHTKSKWLNQIIGCIAYDFIFSMHAQTVCEVGPF